MRTRTRIAVISAGVALLLLSAAPVVDAVIAPEHPLGLHDVEKTIRSIDLQQETFPFPDATDASPTTLSIASPPASGHAYVSNGNVNFLADLDQSTTVAFTAQVGSLSHPSKTDSATFIYHIRGLVHRDTITDVTPGGAATYDVATSFAGYPIGPVTLIATSDDEAEQAGGLLISDDDGSYTWRPTGTRGTFHIDYPTGQVTFNPDRDFTGDATYRYQARVGAQLVTGSATFRAVSSLPRPRPAADLGLRPFTANPVSASGTRTIRIPARSVSAATASVNPAAGSASASVEPGGGVTVTFTPSPAFSGDAVVSVSGDGPAGAQTSQVTFPVTGLGAAPEVVTDHSGRSSVDVTAAFPPETAPTVTGAAVSPAAAGSAAVDGGVVRFTPAPGTALPGGAAMAIEYTVAGRGASMSVNVPAGGTAGGGGGGQPGDGAAGAAPSNAPDGTVDGGTGGGSVRGTQLLANTGSNVSLLAAAGAALSIWVGLLLVIASKRRAAAST